jgi:hypothetical protein
MLVMLVSFYKGRTFRNVDLIDGEYFDDDCNLGYGFDEPQVIADIDLTLYVCNSITTHPSLN